MELSTTTIKWLRDFIRDVDDKFNKNKNGEFEIYSSGNIVLYYDRTTGEVIPFEKDYILKMGDHVKGLLEIRGTTLSENYKLIMRCYEALNNEYL